MNRLTGKKWLGAFLAAAGTAAMCMSAGAAPDAAADLQQAGDKYEYGHFTAEAIAINANSEDFNENPDFTVYSINDYTAEVPMADSYQANGGTDQNNTSSTYIVLTENKAVLVDLGNGAAATASHFGEDSEDQAVLDAINAEYRDLVYSLVGDRELSIVITHNHGDHLGYYNALSEEGLTLYFPEGDYTDKIVENYGDFSEMYDLKLFTPGEEVIEMEDGIELATILCNGHTADSTLYIMNTPVVSYEYDNDGKAVDSDAEYLVFTGDAIGSGSSVWIFSADSMKTLSESIEGAYDTLASYNTYDDYLGNGEKTDANIHIEGGHGWQIWNRFGDMNMDLSYVESLKTLLEKAKDGQWVSAGDDNKTLEELMEEGNLVTKPLDHVFLDTTIYYGPELESAAGMTTSMAALKEYAGLTDPEAETATVDVTGGKVSGVASDVDGVTLYKGIPYGADTSGENRWKAPQDPESWDDVKVCDTWGDQVMQRSAAELNPVGGFWGDEFYFSDKYNPAISENGLNLNVYTPAASADENLPVLVYIHGGGNNHGNASEMEFNAAKLAEKGIIVVTVQYRVSMFGFLTLPGLSAENENGASGNYGVLDLVKALEWVNQNIAGFGGNPEQVTISGQSAGAMNVTALMRTPLAKGLFQNAIIQSGFSGLLTAKGTLSYTDMETKQQEAEVVVREAMGLPEDTTSEELVAELRSHDAEYYMTTKSAVDPEKDLYDAITSASSTYVIDGYVFTEESVDLTRPGALDGINIMIGGTSDEMTSLMGDPEGTVTMDEFAERMAASYGEDYKDAYAPEDEKDAYRQMLRSSSDSAFEKYVLSAEYAEKNNDTNVYVYYFNQMLPEHRNPVRDEEFYGSFHSSELWYFFDSMRDLEKQRLWTDSDYSLADQITSYISNFVKTGDPNGEGLEKWDVCSEETNDSFMWWADGTSQYVEHVNAEREALNRASVLAGWGMTEEDL